MTDPGEFGKQLDDVRATGLAYENDEAVDAVRTTARTISRELGASQWPVPA